MITRGSKAANDAVASSYFLCGAGALARVDS